MNITIITGSRADWGLLEMPIKAMEADPDFNGNVLNIWGTTFSNAFALTKAQIAAERPDIALVLGDRFEILAATTACHLERVPVAHIAGGDVTLGSYDDAMRDCISRMATLHFPTSRDAEQRLRDRGYSNVHHIGNLALDFIMRGAWKRDRPYSEKYVVVAYYPETIDGVIDWTAVKYAINGRFAVLVQPNPDSGSAELMELIRAYAATGMGIAADSMPRAEFLNLLYHCDEFIGNSSAMFYEAPALGIKTRVIGKRQMGRVIPTGDGNSSERIVQALKEYAATK